MNFNVTTKKFSIARSDLLGGNICPLPKNSDIKNSIETMRSAIVSKCLEMTESEIPYLKSIDISVDINFNEEAPKVYSITLGVYGEVDINKFLDLNPKLFGLNAFKGSVEIVISPIGGSPTLCISVDEDVVGGYLKDSFWDKLVSVVAKDYASLASKLADKTLPYLALWTSPWLDVVARRDSF